MTAAFVAAFSLCTLATKARAQEAAPDRMAVSLQVLVKPDMIDEWTDLMKNEALPALKKAGIARVTTNQTVLGVQGEFVIVTPMDNMSLLDLPPVLERALGKEAGARLYARLQRCVVSSRRYVSTMVGALSNPPAEGKSLPVRVFARYRIANGKTEEYENYIKTEVLPQYKKAGIAMSY
ncbi:MAG TPA: hypothetical protein DEH78_32180 [Solibacterales bacterium]|nr:hypothetical protein [Bryobacterales bacterium]